MRGAIVTLNDETALQQANSVLVDMMDKLKNSQEQAKLQNAELQRLATQDPLTNCLNRRSFFEQAELAWAKAVADGQPLSCIMTDIDRFKSINDKFGHAVGDQVIEQGEPLLQLGVIDPAWQAEGHLMMADPDLARALARPPAGQPGVDSLDRPAARADR